MKMIRCASVFFLLGACGQPASSGFDGFETMEGTWVSEPEDGKTFSEHWKISGERMSGQGYLVQGKDTLFGEKLVVEIINGRLVYIADVPGQNLTLFERQGKSKSFRFENKDHDFPKVILYEPQMDDQTLRVVLEGEENGTPVKETLLLKRKKP